MTQNRNDLLLHGHNAASAALLAVSQTALGTGGALAGNQLLVVSKLVGAVVHIAVTTLGTGVSGVTALGTGGRGDGGVIGMGMILLTVLPHRNIVQVAIIEAMPARTEVREAEIPSVEPVHLLALIAVATNKIVVHGTVIHAVHQQVSHIGAVFGNTIFHPVGMLRPGVYPLCLQRHAIVMVGTGQGLTKADKSGILSGLEQEAVPRRRRTRVCGEKHTGPVRSTDTPLQSPFPIVAQDHRLLQ